MTQAVTGCFYWIHPVTAQSVELHQLLRNDAITSDTRQYILQVLKQTVPSKIPSVKLHIMQLEVQYLCPPSCFPKPFSGPNWNFCKANSGLQALCLTSLLYPFKTVKEQN